MTKLWFKFFLISKYWLNLKVAKLKKWATLAKVKKLVEFCINKNLAKP